MPKEPSYYGTDTESLKTLWYSNKGESALPPTNAQLADAEKEAKTRNDKLTHDYNKKMIARNQINLNIVLIIGTVIKESIKSQITSIYDVYQVYSTLK